MNALRKCGDWLKEAAAFCADPLTVRERWVVLWLMLLLIAGTAIRHFRTAPVVSRDSAPEAGATATLSSDLPDTDGQDTK